MKSYYQTRINRALKHIDEHLGEDIDIKSLAEISNFSLFHFHRLFKALTGESPYDSIKRLRLEKAIFLLKYRPNLKVSDIAFESGFASIENFSRQFKTRFQISPSAFRKNKELHNSRIYQEFSPNDFYLHIENSRKSRKANFTIELERLAAIPIVYGKAIFGADGSGLVEKYLELMKWAAENQIEIKGPLRRFGMSIDNPEVTPASKYRYDFALRIEQEYPSVEGLEFGLIPEADYATVQVEGNLEEVAKAWDYLYRDWLPLSDYVPIHYPALEEFIQGPEEIGWDRFNLKCRVPIKKLKR